MIQIGQVYKMKKFVMIILIIFIVVNWEPTKKFVSANLTSINKSFISWLVNHTPTK